MHRYSLPHIVLTQTLTCAELYPRESGAILRFYIRRELTLMRNGSMSVKRAELAGVVKFVGDVIRPNKPRRLYKLATEGARFGSG